MARRKRESFPEMRERLARFIQSAEPSYARLRRGEKLDRPDQEYAPDEQERLDALAEALTHSPRHVQGEAFRRFTNRKGHLDIGAMAEAIAHGKFSLSR